MLLHRGGGKKEESLDERRRESGHVDGAKRWVENNLDYLCSIQDDYLTFCDIVEDCLVRSTSVSEFAESLPR